MKKILCEMNNFQKSDVIHWKVFSKRQSLMNYRHNCHLHYFFGVLDMQRITSGTKVRKSLYVDCHPIKFIPVHLKLKISLSKCYF